MTNPEPTHDPADQREPNNEGGDQITVGNITNATGVAIGRGATAIVQTILNLPRYLVVIMIFAALLLIIGGLTLTGAQFSGFRQTLREARLLPPAFASEQPGETLIVVAPFFHPQGVPDDQEATLIKTAINEQIQSLGIANLRVAVDDGAPIPAEDRDGAQALGEHYHASMVIWGSNTRPQLTINYLNLREPKFDAAQVKLQESGTKGRTQLANPSAYAGFITNDAPKSMAFLSLFAVGQSAYINQDYPRATKIISSVLDLLQDVQPLPPGTADAYFRLGWLYQVPPQGSEKALMAYTQAITLDPKLVEAYNNRGIIRDQKGDLDGAMVDYTQAITLDPTYANPYNNRGISHYHKGDFDDAIADYTQAITLDPKSANAYNNRGSARNEKGDVNGAIADYNQAITLDPTLAQAYYNRGAANVNKGDLDSALADYNQAIILDPKSADNYYNRAATRKAKGDVNGAIADYTQAITLNPTFFQAYYNRGFVHAENGNLDSAMADYTQVIALNPTFAPAYINRGLVYMDKGDLDNAIADFTQAITLNPQSVNAFINRGNSYADNGDLDRALADYTQAITLNPQSVNAYMNRGNAYTNKGDLDRALADYTQTISLDPTHVNAYYNRGQIYQQRQQRDAAIADFRRARDLATDTNDRQDAIDRLKELGVSE